MSKLLFINKSAQSTLFGHSTDEREKFLINAHVQSQRRYLRRDQSKIKLSSTRPKLLEFLRREDLEFANDDILASTSSDRGREEMGTSCPRLGRLQENECAVQYEPLTTEEDGFPGQKSKASRGVVVQERDAWQQRHQQERDRHWQVARSYRPQNQATDPFNVSCVRIDEEMYKLLRYYQQTNKYWQYFHTQSLEKQELETTDSSEKGAEDILGGLLSDEVSMYTQLSEIAGQVKMEGKMVLYRDVSYYITRAIKSFRKRLMANPEVDERMILNAFNLAAAHWYLYNLDASLVHSKALKQLVSLTGGVKCLTPLLRGMIGAGYSLLAAEMSASPLFDSKDFEPEYDSEISEWLNRLGDDPRNDPREQAIDVASELKRSEHYAVLSDELHTVILELRECTSASLLSRTTQESPTGIQQWVHLRGLAIRYRLLAMSTADARTDAIRIALTMWTLIVMTLAGRQRTVKLMAPKLKAILSGIGIRKWYGHHMIRLWILTIGAMSAATGSATQGWFDQEIVGALDGWGTSNLKKEDGLVEFSKQFFYLDSIQALMIRSLANRLACTVAGR